MGRVAAGAARKEVPMPAYALAHLRTPQINDEVLTYIERIQATMAPYGGRFLVHGAEVEVVEDDWPGTVVIIEFPDLAVRPGLVRLGGLPGDPAAAHPQHRGRSHHRRRRAARLRRHGDRRAACGRRLNSLNRLGPVPPRSRTAV